MALDLPNKAATATGSSADRLRWELRSCVAGRPRAKNPWTFYEIIDGYLGPWGENGYPIGYGKKYCVLFNSSDDLKRTPMAVKWVERTTVLLQEMLISYIVSRFFAGTLSRLTEPELRRYAFESHPKAYLDGGLVHLAMVNPSAIPVIATIPGAEFSPNSPNFFATIEQLLLTVAHGIPRSLGHGIAAMMPVHSGLFRRAMDADRQAMRDSDAGWVWPVKRKIEEGRADDLKVLTNLIEMLSTSMIPPEARREAEEALDQAKARRRSLAAIYKRIEAQDPKVGAWLDGYVPGWRHF